MKNIKIYALSTCPWCMKAKRYFTKREIPFEYIDYDLASDTEQDEIIKDIEKRGGDGSYPFTIIGDDFVNGFDPDEYNRLLGL